MRSSGSGSNEDTYIYIKRIKRCGDQYRLFLSDSERAEAAGSRIFALRWK